MTAFVWDASFVTGEPDVDAQPFALVQLINHCGDLVTEGHAWASSELDAAFDELSAYAATHFMEEERLMDETGLDPETRQEHRHLHHTFVRELARMRSALPVAADHAADGLLGFLVHWLAAHILDADQALVREIRLVRAGRSPHEARAAETARHSHADPLVRALNGLFAIISARNAALALANEDLEAKVAARTAELAAANQQLQVLASTDLLTGLANRRQALASLDARWAEAPASLALAVVLLDADGFKAVNDTWGHDAGDEVLRILARTLTEWVRTDDLVCRLGGDEFLILCPATDLPGATRVAETVRAAVSGRRFPVGDGTWTGSVSAGAAARTPAMRNPTALLKAADDALYEAKRAGRNRVVAAAEPA